MTGLSSLDDQTRSVILDRVIPTFAERGFTIEAVLNEKGLVDFHAYREDHVYVGHIGLPMSYCDEIVLLADQAADVDGLILVSPDQSVLHGAMDLLRKPYHQITHGGVIPYTTGVIATDDHTLPVVPADTHYSWTLTHTGQLYLIADDDIVATGDATESVATYDFDTYHYDAGLIRTADGTVVARADDQPSLERWSPISIPIVPRAGEYRSELDDVQLWYLDVDGPVEVDTTAPWIFDHQLHHQERRLIDYAVEVFTETHLVTATGFHIHRDEFHTVFNRWFTAETGRSTPPTSVIEQYLPARNSRQSDEEITASLRNYRWRIPRGINSPDLPIDSPVMER